MIQRSPSAPRIAAKRVDCGAVPGNDGADRCHRGRRRGARRRRSRSRPRWEHWFPSPGRSRTRRATLARVSRDRERRRQDRHRAWRLFPSRASSPRARSRIGFANRRPGFRAMWPCRSVTLGKARTRSRTLRSSNGRLTTMASSPLSARSFQPPYWYQRKSPVRSPRMAPCCNELVHQLREIVLTGSDSPTAIDRGHVALAGRPCGSIAARGQLIALDERDTVEVVRERPRCTEPCHASRQGQSRVLSSLPLPTSDGVYAPGRPSDDKMDWQSA